MKGILFTPDNIRAIREGRKTVTRRVIKLRGKAYKFMRDNGYGSIQHDEVIYPDGGGNWIGWDKDSPELAEFTKKAYPNGEGFKSLYQSGETVYVKEAYLNMPWRDVMYPLYLTPPAKIWKSPLFMPEKYARTFLKILSVRPERLQEITEEDANAEGIYDSSDPIQARVRYASLWNSINKPPYDWASNPWCWRIEFKLLSQVKEK